MAIAEGEEEGEEEEEEEEEEVIVIPEIEEVSETPRTAFYNSPAAKVFLAGIDTASEEEEQQEPAPAGEAQHNAESPGDATLPAPVPAGDKVWQQLQTEEGVIYYHNTVTDVTSWDAPTSMPQPLPPPQPQQQPAPAAGSLAPVVQTAVTVEKARSKMWAMLGSSGRDGEAGALEGAATSKFDELVVSTLSSAEDEGGEDGEGAC